MAHTDTTTTEDYDYPLTEGQVSDLLYLLDRLICRQEDRGDNKRADHLAYTYQLIKDIEAGR